MKLIDTAIPGVKLLEPQAFDGTRGFFMEAFRDERSKANVCDHTFVQENYSKSGRGVLRGLHYQTENTQGKLVCVVVGEVSDVTVNMCKSSPAFGKWAGGILSTENKRQPWVLGGFTHGSYVLSGKTGFVCKCADYYNPEAEHSLTWNDPSVGIDWPLQGEPNLSPKNLAGKMLAGAVTF